MRLVTLPSLALALLLAGACASAPPKKPAEPFREGAPCNESLHGILEQVKRSQVMHCATDAECALVTSPLSPGADARVAVHVKDRERLDRHAKEHLERCGAFRGADKGEGSTRTFRARCIGNRCQRELTGLDLEE
jgi:hypothetical protein